MIKEVCSIYMTKGERELNKFLEDKNCKELLKDLLLLYTNDKNSSFLREMISCVISGFNHCTDKLGYDGSKDGVFCEVKPQNVILDNKSRLDGGGTFTDFTWRKFNKCKEDDVQMIMSGFVDGKLMFIIHFPFNNEDFKNHLLSKLNKYLPNGDETNHYIRSCQWSFIHYKSAKIIYVADNINDYQRKFTKKLFNFLTGVVLDNGK